MVDIDEILLNKESLLDREIITRDPTILQKLLSFGNCIVLYVDTHTHIRVRFFSKPTKVDKRIFPKRTSLGRTVFIRSMGRNGFKAEILSK